MNTHAVKLQVEAKVPKECIFWLEADGWTGICEELSITVQGSSFEDVKRAMQAALQEHIETVLRENAKTSLQLRVLRLGLLQDGDVGVPSLQRARNNRGTFDAFSDTSPGTHELPTTVH